MEWNEKQKILDKISFYRTNAIMSHVLTVPKGTFKNGLFVSEIENDSFVWFLEKNLEEPIRLFISEIHEIQDYKEEVKE